MVFLAFMLNFVVDSEGDGLDAPTRHAYGLIADRCDVPANSLYPAPEADWYPPTGGVVRYYRSTARDRTGVVALLVSDPSNPPSVTSVVIGCP